MTDRERKERAEAKIAGTKRVFKRLTAAVLVLAAVAEMASVAFIKPDRKKL